MHQKSHKFDIPTKQTNNLRRVRHINPKTCFECDSKTEVLLFNIDEYRQTRYVESLFRRNIWLAISLLLVGVNAFKNCDGSESLRIRTRNYKVSELPTVIPRLLPLSFRVKCLHELPALFGIWLRLVIFNVFFLFTLQYFMSVFTSADSRSACYTPLCLSSSVNWKAHPKRMNEESVNLITRNEGHKPEQILQAPYPGFKQKKKLMKIYEKEIISRTSPKWVISKLLAKEKKTTT